VPVVASTLVTSFDTVRVAAIQATPAILDADATIEKAERLLHDAADAGVRLAVLPECFVSLYPSGSWAGSTNPWNDAFDALWERLWASSVDVPGPMLDRLGAVCRERDLHVAVGVNERDSARPGSLWNTLAYYGPAGFLGKHRKLMPTVHERLFHAVGAGDDLQVHDTPVGRIGGLICWENMMPLARYAVYRGGPQIYVAPTADDSASWLGSMRHIAYEAGAFVVSAPQFIPAAAFPADFPVALPEGKDVLGNGGAAIVSPVDGEVVAGPLYGEEGMVVHDCDLRACLHAKRSFDVVGHYSRAEVLR
jgi:nitrilase